MSNYICWVCDQLEDRKSDLKHHLSSVHHRLTVICPWCPQKESTFRKAVDLKAHVRSSHKSIYRESSADYFGEPNCFWLAIYPNDYRKIINPTRPDSSDAKLLRSAVERWVIKLGDRTSRSLKQWQEGWSTLPLLSPSPSPVLDYNENLKVLQLKIHDLTVSSDRIQAVVYERLISQLGWYKVIIENSVRSNPKMIASLLRRMEQVEPFEGIVPSAFSKQLQDDRLRVAKGRLSGLLKIDSKYVSTIWREDSVSFAADKEPPKPTKKRRETETSNPPPKKAKTEQSKQSPKPPKIQIESSQQSREFPLDTLLKADTPTATPGTSTSNTTKKRTETPTAGVVTKPPISTTTVTSTSSEARSVSCDDVIMTTTVSPRVVSSNSVPKSSAADVAVSTQGSTSTARSDPTPMPSETDVAILTKGSCSTSSSTDTVTKGSSSTPSSTFTATVTEGHTSTSSSTSIGSVPSIQADQQSPEEVQLGMTDSDETSSVGLGTEVIDATGDHQHSRNIPADERGQTYSPTVPGSLFLRAYSPSLPVTRSFPTYSPTPRNQMMTVVPSDLPNRAEMLLRFGCMPLLPPARRNWVNEETIVLPASSPVSRWPPKNWVSMTSDAKLLLLETVATSLTLKDGLSSDLDRGEVIDAYNFLALPGSASIPLSSPMQMARYSNFRVLKYIALLKCAPAEKMRQFVEQMEAAKAASQPAVSTSVILQQIERKKINLRI